MDQLSLLIWLPIVAALVTFWLWMYREFLREDRFTDNERVMCAGTKIGADCVRAAV